MKIKLSAIGRIFELDSISVRIELGRRLPEWTRYLSVNEQPCLERRDLGLLSDRHDRSLSFKVPDS